jgi:paraquat-inducible protein A
VWRTIDSRGLWHHTPVDGGGRWIGCGSCGLVNADHEGAPCARCGHTLRPRKVQAIGRSWAMTVAAVLLYIPANALPVMDLRRLGRGGPSTILKGVQELIAAHLWLLAVIVLLASIAVPLLKLAGLAVMLVMTRRRSRARLRDRTRWFRFIRAIGRWSMVDIFVLNVLVALVHMGFLAVVLPGPGAMAFCAVVVVTLCATEFFDPRSMWDAAGANSGGASAPASNGHPPELGAA